MYLFLVAPGLCCGMGLPLVVESGNYSLVMVLRLPLGDSSSCGHRLSGPQASAAATRWLSTDSAVVAHGLSCSVAARGISSDQSSDPCLPRWQADSLPLHHQENPGLKLLRSRCVLSSISFPKLDTDADGMAEPQTEGGWVPKSAGRGAARGQHRSLVFPLPSAMGV